MTGLPSTFVNWLGMFLRLRVERPPASTTTAVRAPLRLRRRVAGASGPRYEEPRISSTGMSSASDRPSSLLTGSSLAPDSILAMADRLRYPMASARSCWESPSSILRTLMLVAISIFCRPVAFMLLTVRKHMMPDSTATMQKDASFSFSWF